MKKRIVKFRSGRRWFIADTRLSALREKIREKRGELNRLRGLLKRYPQSQKIKEHIDSLERELEKLEKKYYKMLGEKLKEDYWK